MDLNKAKRAIQATAKREGITESEVVKNIEQAIAEAMNNARKNQDIEVLQRWEQIPHVGEVPTAYELVAYLARKLSSRAAN